MAQTAAIFKQSAGSVDYTPGSAVTGGAVIINGGQVMVALRDIAAGALGQLVNEGVVAFPKETGAITYGDRVFWKPTGTPVTGDASSGAASKATGDALAGVCVKAAVSGDSYVYVLLGVGAVRRAVKAVAATGSTAADAAQLIEGLNVVSAADATKGVLLPAATPGAEVVVKNTVAAVLKIWPATGDQVNAVAVDGAFSIAASTSVLLIAYDTTTWYSVPLLPS
jgi:predicted RecA/RadA family phage recombinase